MINTPQDMEQLRGEFKDCQKIFTALGNETRQHLLLVMLADDCSGSRVVDLAAKTYLSRPAVSHHIQVLKKAGIVHKRREGTCLYYYLNPQDSVITKMIQLMNHIQKLMQNVADESNHCDT